MFPNELPKHRGENWWALQELGWSLKDSILHRLKLKRAGANLHIGERSDGCITVDGSLRDQYNLLTNLLHKEASNKLTVQDYPDYYYTPLPSFSPDLRIYGIR